MSEEKKAEGPLPWESEEDAAKRTAEEAKVIQTPSMGAWTAPMKCSVCGEDQTRTPSGDVCKNGHGGVMPRAPSPSDAPVRFHSVSMIEANKVLDPATVVAPVSTQFSPYDDDAEEEKPKANLAPDPPSWTLSKDQAAARDGVMAWWKSNERGTKTLGGYAGTGKTTLMGVLAYQLLSDGVSVAFATPTGKAALVLERSLHNAGVYDAGVSTIHGLIYRPDEDPETGRIRGWRRQRTVDASLIVVDEASMVSQRMLEDLQSFNKPILAIGDHGQLPPVGEKAGLMANPDFRLEKIHRQAKGNPIIRLATIIRNGAPKEAVRSFIEDQDDERVQIGSKADGKKFGAPPGMLITYTNRLRTGLNAQLRHELHGYDEEVDPQKGEIVICLKNHRLDEGGLMIANGMRGEVVSCQDHPKSKHHYEMAVQFDDPVGLVSGLRVNKHQFLKEGTFKGFDEVPGDHRNWWSVGALFDFGYALTCHKAQGSQFDNVMIIDESHVFKHNAQRWLYTAITRAAEQVTIKI